VDPLKPILTIFLSFLSFYISFLSFFLFPSLSTFFPTCSLRVGTPGHNRSCPCETGHLLGGGRQKNKVWNSTKFSPGWFRIPELKLLAAFITIKGPRTFTVPPPPPPRADSLTSGEKSTKTMRVWKDNCFSNYGRLAGTVYYSHSMVAFSMFISFFLSAPSFSVSFFPSFFSL
jgi:hypothetical protein